MMYQNAARWRNPQFDRLLVEARGEADEALRKQLYGEMQRLVHDEAGVAIPVFISLIDGHDVRLKGLHPIPIGGLMGYMFAEPDLATVFARTQASVGP